MLTTTTLIAKTETSLREQLRVQRLPTGKGLIIEFVGPTGSGKTTNCIQFYSLLKKEKLHVYVFKDIKEYLYTLKFYRRYRLYLKTLLFGTHNLLSYTFLLASHGIYSFDSIYRYVKLCIFNDAVYQFIQTRQVDILLLDQWIIQGLWSATIFKGVPYGNLHDALKRFYFKADYVLYFDIDEETACERIRSRDSRRSRFDQMSHQDKLSGLKRYNPYLRMMFENSDCKNKLTFSTGISPVKNAEAFLHWLKGSISDPK